MQLPSAAYGLLDRLTEVSVNSRNTKSGIGAFMTAMLFAAIASADPVCSTGEGSFIYERRTVVGHSAHFSNPALQLSGDASNKAYFRASDTTSIEGFCFLQGYRQGRVSQAIPLHPSLVGMTVVLDAQGELLDLSRSRANLEAARVTGITCRGRR